MIEEDLAEDRATAQQRSEADPAVLSWTNERLGLTCMDTHVSWCLMKTVSTIPGTSQRHQHAGTPPPELPERATLDAAGDLLRALAAPVRIAIVLQLREQARCVHELVDTLDVAQPLVSQHLRILKAAGVVDGLRSGREVLYRLVDHHLADIVIAAVTHAAEGVEDSL